MSPECTKFIQSMNDFSNRIRTDKKFRAQYYVRMLFNNHEIDFDYDKQILLIDYQMYFMIFRSMPEEIEVKVDNLEYLNLEADKIYIMKKEEENE